MTQVIIVGHAAVSVLVTFWAIGLLAIVAKFATTKPRHRRRPPRV